MSEEKKEVYEYQAEMKKLLDILVHSLYTEREIFLRELVSNASDALSKIQFIALTNPDILDKEASLEIRVSFDEATKTLTIEDTGIGMTKDEIIQNIGTIASSGTLNFIREMQQQQSANKAENLIGQFGVGFYSVFMVAQKVVLETRSYQLEGQGWEWTSEGSGQYQLRPIEKASRGTRLTIYLKEEAHEFCAQYRLEGIVKKYSNYIPFPVIIKEKTVNQVRALWTISKNEVKAEDYEEFYKQLTHDFKAPLFQMHLSIDAPIQYYALIFLPQEITNEVLYTREASGLSLYAQRVFIQSDNKHLLPPYLRFIRGLVDSEDIPLNVSRESVQRSALIEKIKKSLVTRILKELQNVAETNVEKYAEIWKQYGTLLKEGVTADHANRDKLIELLRFNSSISENATENVSLKDYVGRMRESQKEIYFAVGASREAILHHPNLEYFKKNGLEVIYLFNHIDDFLMNDLREYQGKPLKSISQAEVEAIQDVDSEKEALPKEEVDSLVKFFKETLGERVAEVLESKRLVGSPCSLVSPKEGMSSHMEKMMKMVNKDFQISKKNLELNLSHKILRNMAALLKQDAASPVLTEYAEQLFQGALLVEGLLDNPLEILPRVYRLMEDASEFHLRSKA